MKKSLQVVVVFKFNGIDGIESDEANKIIQEITEGTDDWRIDSGADAVWLDEAFLVDTEVAR
jgi:hypothetical protein